MLGANTVTAVDAFCAAWSTVGQAFRSAAKIERLGGPDATDAMVWPAAPLLSAAAVSASVASTRRSERAMTLKALAAAAFKLSRVEVAQYTGKAEANGLPRIAAVEWSPSCAPGRLMY